jgi:hypothetical protein
VSVMDQCLVYFDVSLLLLSLDALRGCNVFTQNVMILSCIMLLLLLDVLKVQ